MDTLSPDTLIVTWWHPFTGVRHDIGELRRTNGSYAFSYLRAAAAVDGFRTILGFPDLDTVYESELLFPMFEQRVLSARRPDYPAFMARLGLPESASAWEQLAVSGGSREGDTLELRRP